MMKNLRASIELGALVLVLQVALTTKSAEALSGVNPNQLRQLIVPDFNRDSGKSSDDDRGRALGILRDGSLGFLTPATHALSFSPFLRKNGPGCPSVDRPRHAPRFGVLPASLDDVPSGAAFRGMKQGAIALSCMARRGGRGGRQASSGEGSAGRKWSKGGGGVRVASGKPAAVEKKAFDSEGHKRVGKSEHIHAAHVDVQANGKHHPNEIMSHTQTRSLSLDFERPSTKEPTLKKAKSNGSSTGGTGIPAKQTETRKRLTVKVDGTDEILFRSSEHSAQNPKADASGPEAAVTRKSSAGSDQVDQSKAKNEATEQARNNKIKSSKTEVRADSAAKNAKHKESNKSAHGGDSNHARTDKNIYSKAPSKATSATVLRKRSGTLSTTTSHKQREPSGEEGAGSKLKATEASSPQESPSTVQKGQAGGAGEKEAGSQKASGGKAKNTRLGSAGGHKGSRKKKPRKESLYSVAVRHQKRGNYSAARSIFSMLCDDQGEKDGRVFLAWGRMEARLGNMGSARRAFAKGLQQLPDNVHLVHAWAVEEMRDNNIDDARKLLDYALEREPQDGLLYQTYSLLEQQHGTPERAREFLEQGTAQDPTNVYLWNACGVFESKQGNLEAALRMFEQATVLRPSHCQSWQAFGVVLEKLGRFPEAQEKFETALQIDPQSVPTYQAYGLMQARRGETDLARQLFARGVEFGPKHAPIFHAWATMEMKLDNHDRARELFHAGVEAAPSSVALLKSWALMELELGHIDSSNGWYVSPKMGIKRLEQMGDKLEMLRRLIEQRSEDDIKLVMKWIEAQKIRKLKQKVFEVLKIGAQVPADWNMGKQYDFSDNYKFQISEAVVVKNKDGVLVFGRIANRAKADPSKPDSQFYSVDVIAQSSKTLQRNSKGKIRRPPTVKYDHRHIGKVLLPQSEIVAQAAPAMQMPSRTEGAGADQELLDDIMSRYGEDFTVNPFMEVWWNDLERANEQASSNSWDGSESEARDDGWVASAAQSHDVTMIEKWLKRRSDDDVSAFKAWFNDMYEQDRGVGMVLLDGDLNAQQLQHMGRVASEAPQPPKEWTTLPESTVQNITLLETSVSTADSLIQQAFENLGVQPAWVRIIEGLVIFSFLATGATIGPEFMSQWVQRGDPNQVMGPSGVDAHLIQTDFSDNPDARPPGAIDDCSPKVPRYGARGIPTCSSDGTKPAPNSGTQSSTSK